MESSMASNGGRVQPTEKTLGKALKSPLRQDLGELPPLHFVYPDRMNLTVWSAGRLFGSIEAGRTNRVISPYNLDISPSAALPAHRSRT
jgi:hypothetical protein